MQRAKAALVCASVCTLIVSFGGVVPLFANTSAAVTGRITDPRGLVLPAARVQATNILTNITFSGETNDEGLYRIPNIPPGEYRIAVQHDGFATVVKPGVELHVQDIVTLNFSMQLGSVSQTITVEGGAPLVQTESGAVSTVVNRQFVENMPLNGRSFQTLVSLTPGVVLTRADVNNQGQFSVNGQRADANYFTIDGVSANINVSLNIGLTQSASGSLPGFSVSGGTNNLVSVDALQEFRIQTSTFAPEFGRTPGGQVSIVTRSGTNELHGALFDYFRNDALDANDWFANSRGFPKSALRQNDFGGVLGGPLLKNRTFFFFSYEGLRLRQPQTTVTTVPSAGARQTAVARIQPFLNAYPISNGTDFGNGTAEFAASFSNPVNLNATSIRVDHTINQRLTVFARYNYSPSEIEQRGSGTNTLSNLTVTRVSSENSDPFHSGNSEPPGDSRKG